MKKTICFVISVLMIVMLFSCGKAENDKSADTKKNNETEKVSDEDYKITGPSVQEGLEYDYSDLSEYIDICDYKNLSVKCKKIEASDAEVNAMINSALAKAGTTSPVAGRGAADGDTVTFTGKGVFTDDNDSFAISEKTSIVIGSGDEQGFAEGFDKCFIGAEAGGEFTFTYTYSKDYSHDNFAGRTVNYTMNIVSVNVVKPAELNDTVVKSFNIDGVGTVSEYKEYCKDYIERYAAEQNKQSVQNEIYAALLEKSTVKKYPEKELKYYYDFHDKSCQSYATATAVSVEQYQIDKYGSVEQYEKVREQESKDSVKKDLIVNFIARELGIKVGADEYEEALRYGYQNYGAQSGMDNLSDFEKIYSSDITTGLLTVSILESLYETVDVVYE